MRRHRTQMSEQETEVLEDFIHSQRFRSVSTHTVERIKAHGVSLSQVREALQLGQVIEIRDTRRGVRALVRHSSGAPKDVAAVVGLKDRVIITAWLNNPDDWHSTLDKEKYTWEVNVFDLIQRLTH